MQDLDHTFSDQEEDGPPPEPDTTPGVADGPGSAGHAAPEVAPELEVEAAEDSEIEHEAKAQQLSEKPTPFKEPDQDTRTMDELWNEIASEWPAQPATPPSYITDCAAFQAVPEAAVRVGRSFHRMTHHIESFYCKAYKISAKDQSLFRGRGLQYDLTNTEQKEKGQRRMRYSTYSANWWARAESATSALAKLKRRQVGEKEITALETCCRRLALDGVPTAGATASATARLHRAVWQDRQWRQMVYVRSISQPRSHMDP